MQDIVRNLYYYAGSLWNDKIDSTLDALTMNFSDAASLARLMERLTEHVFLPIAGLLATVFLIIRFCSLALDNRGQLDIWGIAKLFIRCFLCMALVQNTYQIILELVRASTKIVDSVAYWASGVLNSGTSVSSALKIPSVSRQNYGYVAYDVFDEIGTLWCFVLLILMLIFVIASLILSYVIYFSALIRFFKIMVYGSFATVSLVTCIGGPEVSRVGTTYIKYMLGLIFSNVLAYVTMLFAGLVRDDIISSVTVTVSATLSSSDYVLSILGVCAATIAFMAFCCVTVAGTDRVMQRTFAM